MLNYFLWIPLAMMPFAYLLLVRIKMQPRIKKRAVRWLVLVWSGSILLFNVIPKITRKQATGWSILQVASGPAGNHSA